MFIPIVFFNGEFLPETQAVIPISDRGFLFGEGIFTTLRVYQGRIECLSRHLDRLQRHCNVLKIKYPKIPISIFPELIEKNHASTGCWRLKMIITGGEPNKVDYDSLRAHGQLLITLNPYQEQNTTYHLTIYPEPIVRPCSQIKSLSYLDRFLFADYAKNRHFDDALTYDSNGFILETAFSNVFWRLGNQLIIPDFSLPYLKGITLQLAIESANSMGMSTLYAKTKFDHIPRQSQMFLCNSLKGIKPIIGIDGLSFARDQSWEHSFLQCYNQIVLRESYSS